VSGDHDGHNHGHNHGHDHGGGDGGHHDASIAARVRELEAQLVAAGVTTEAALEEILLEGWNGSPAAGAAIVAKAWSDPGFRERLLADGNAAVTELGLEADGYLLKAVENTADVHNLIVCTLCSCYPTNLLGPSPGWYKSFAYRARAVREPREVLAEFGVELPETTEITVWDSTAEARYIVVPARPAGSDGLPEAGLAALVTRNGLVGTAAV
jgi:nitrile hydratase subunit alpha